MNVKAVLKRVKRFFFPLRCNLCGEIIPIEKDRCFCYETQIEFTDENRCLFCGLKKENCMCDEGAIKLPFFTAPFVYSGYIKKYIQAFKFDGKKSYAKNLGNRMGFKFLSVFPNVQADIVTFVPLSENSLKERGYNQSELLAKQVASFIKIPCSCLIEKIKETEKQHTLDAYERKTNLQNAFSLSLGASVHGKTIVLCDDIKTTGSTLKACSDVLFEAGAENVYCLAAAVTEYEKLPF